MKKIIFLTMIMVVGSISVMARSSYNDNLFSQSSGYGVWDDAGTPINTYNFLNAGSDPPAPINPGGHGTGGDHPLPISSGGLILAGFGVAYLFMKKKKE